jgi:hypothetical protein
MFVCSLCYTNPLITLEESRRPTEMVNSKGKVHGANLQAHLKTQHGFNKYGVRVRICSEGPSKCNSAEMKNDYQSCNLKWES